MLDTLKRLVCTTLYYTLIVVLDIVYAVLINDVISIIANMVAK